MATQVSSFGLGKRLQYQKEINQHVTELQSS
jgi:hypothetical protein